MTDEPNPFEPPKLDPYRFQTPLTPARVVYVGCLGVLILLTVLLFIVVVTVGLEIDLWSR